MAPVATPNEQREFLTVTGTGTLLLTQPQRTAQSLSVSIEKVRLFPTPEYYNFRQPEPESFWGYLQLVQRDFVQKLIQLNYRRQSVLNSSRYELEPIEQLRCLVKDSTLTLFDAITAIILASGGDPSTVGQQRAEYILRNAQPRLIPAVPTTAIYYEIAPGWAGLISIIWTGYAQPCAQLEPPQILPSPRSPGKDESGPSNNDGGGTRPTIPPPRDRSSDPDSDNAAPPPDSPAGPPTPGPAPDPTATPYSLQFQLSLCRRQPSGSYGYRPGTTDTIQVPDGPVTIAPGTAPDSGLPTIDAVGPNGTRTPLYIGANDPSPCGGPFAVVNIISQTPI